MFDCRKLLLEKAILLAKLIVLLLQAFSNILQSYVPLNLPLFILLDLGLQFGELCLLALTKRPLRSSEGILSRRE